MREGEHVGGKPVKHGNPCVPAVLRKGRGWLFAVGPKGTAAAAYPTHTTQDRELGDKIVRDELPCGLVSPVSQKLSVTEVGG